MKDINILVEKLNVEINPDNPQNSFKMVIDEIVSYYCENLGLHENEVAILLANKEKTILSFASPQYLVNSGIIPVNSTDALASSIFRSGSPLLDNNLQQQKHLTIFEMIKTPDDEVKPIWKMIGVIISKDGDNMGVLELSKRGSDFAEAGRDFSTQELTFVQKSLEKFAPYIKQVLPEDFSGKVTATS